jgi:hypothetical protein
VVEQTRKAAHNVWGGIRRRPVQSAVAALVLAGGLTSALVAGSFAPASAQCGTGYGYAFSFSCPPAPANSSAPQQQFAAISSGGSVVSQPDGAPSVFVEGTGGSLWNYWYNAGTWLSSEIAASGVTSAPVATLQPNGSPTVFVEETGGGLVNYWYVPASGTATASWAKQVITTSGVTSAPAVQLQPNGSPTVFVEGSGGSILNYWYIPMGTSSFWGSATVVTSGDAPHAQVAVTLQPNFSPTLFVRGPGGQVFNYWYVPMGTSSYWGAATVATSGALSTPAVTLQNNGDPSLFVRATGGSVLNYWYVPDGASSFWGAGTVVSSGVAQRPSVQLQPNGNPSIMVTTTSGSILNYWYIPQGSTSFWGAATVRSGGIIGPPREMLQINGSPTVFAEGTGGSLLNFWYVPMGASSYWGAGTVTPSGVVAY